MTERKIVGLIEEYLWKMIHTLLPIVCVDLAIIHRKTVLLLKRTIEPEAGKWMLPGGRMWKNETPDLTCFRIMREELGWSQSMVGVGVPEAMGWMSNRYDVSPFGENTGTHTVSLVHKIVLQDDLEFEIKPDPNHESYIWWDGAEGSLGGIGESHLHYMRVGLGLPEIIHEENDIEHAVMRNANEL